MSVEIFSRQRGGLYYLFFDEDVLPVTVVTPIPPIPPTPPPPEVGGGVVIIKRPPRMEELEPLRFPEPAEARSRLRIIARARAATIEPDRAVARLRLAAALAPRDIYRTAAVSAVIALGNAAAERRRWVRIGSVTARAIAADRARAIIAMDAVVDGEAERPRPNLLTGDPLALLR